MERDACSAPLNISSLEPVTRPDGLDATHKVINGNDSAELALETGRRLRHELHFYTPPVPALVILARISRR